LMTALPEAPTAARYMRAAGRITRPALFFKAAINPYVAERALGHVGLS
jgi:hypothetical protein